MTDDQADDLFLWRIVGTDHPHRNIMRQVYAKMMQRRDKPWQYGFARRPVPVEHKDRKDATE